MWSQYFLFDWSAEEQIPIKDRRAIHLMYHSIRTSIKWQHGSSVIML